MRYRCGNDSKPENLERYEYSFKPNGNTRVREIPPNARMRQLLCGAEGPTRCRYGRSWRSEARRTARLHLPGPNFGSTLSSEHGPLLPKGKRSQQRL